MKFLTASTALGAHALVSRCRDKGRQAAGGALTTANGTELPGKGGGGRRGGTSSLPRELRKSAEKRRLRGQEGPVSLGGHGISPKRLEISGHALLSTDIGRDAAGTNWLFAARPAPPTRRDAMVTATGKATARSSRTNTSLDAGSASVQGGALSL